MIDDRINEAKRQAIQEITMNAWGTYGSIVADKIIIALRRIDTLVDLAVRTPKRER